MGGSGGVMAAAAKSARVLMLAPTLVAFAILRREGGPKGVKKSKFTSQTSSVEGFKFTKKFKKPGKYNFYCTIHPDVMKMTVKVKG